MNSVTVMEIESVLNNTKYLLEKFPFMLQGLDLLPSNTRFLREVLVNEANNLGSFSDSFDVIRRDIVGYSKVIAMVFMKELEEENSNRMRIALTNLEQVLKVKSLSTPIEVLKAELSFCRVDTEFMKFMSTFITYCERF